jgi:hypothetical protein
MATVVVVDLFGAYGFVAMAFLFLYAGILRVVRV